MKIIKSISTYIYNIFLHTYMMTFKEKVFLFIFILSLHFIRVICHCVLYKLLYWLQKVWYMIHRLVQFMFQSVYRGRVANNISPFIYTKQNKKHTQHINVHNFKFLNYFFVYSTVFFLGCCRSFYSLLFSVFKCRSITL